MLLPSPIPRAFRFSTTATLLLATLWLTAAGCSNGDAERNEPLAIDGLVEYIDRTIAPPEPELVDEDEVTAKPIVWSFDGDDVLTKSNGKLEAEGWTLRHDIADASVDRGRLILEPSGIDPQLVIHGSFDLRKYGTLEVRMASEVDTNVGIFWRFEDEPFTSDALSTVRLRGGKLRTLQMSIGPDVPARNIVTSMRFDPTDEMRRVGIDEIRLLPVTRDPIQLALESTAFQIDDDLRPGRAFSTRFETSDLVDLSRHPVLERSVANLSPKSAMIVRIDVEDDNGATRNLETVLPPDSKWQDLRLDLEGLGERRVRVTTRSSFASPQSESNLGVLGECRVIERRADTQPDILLISIDTLRADRMSMYGHSRQTTPNLDRLAARSVRFDRPVAQSPWTLPSVASYLTSRYPRSLGIHFAVRHSIPPAMPTLTELLRDEGYDTACVFANSVMERDLGFERGFSSFAFGEKAEFRAEETTDRAIAWLDERRHRRMFLYAHYMDPHSPYQPPGEAWRTNPFYDESDIEVPPVNNSDLFYGRETATPERTALLLRMYDAEIRYTDEHIGRLLDRLEADGRLDDMLVIVTSDHGEEFNDHGSWNHAITLYDEMLRVPLFVKFPRDAGAGAVVETSTPLLDIMPTILEAAGISYGHLELEGHPLRAEPTAPSSDRLLYAETDVHGPLRTGIITDRWKLIRFEREHGYWNERDVLFSFLSEHHPLIALFDREADPAERHNLADQHPDVVEALSEQIRDFRHTAAAAAPPLEDVEDGAPRATEERLRKLRALGYLDDHEEDDETDEDRGKADAGEGG